MSPVQRHITGVLENTRVFDEKYPGIFSTLVLWCHITGVLTNTWVFSIKYPGIWQPVKYPGKWQQKQCAVCTGILSGVLSFTDFSLSSSFECYMWMPITERGQAGGGGGGSDCKQKYGRNYIFDGFWSSKKLEILHGM